MLGECECRVKRLTVGREEAHKLDDELSKFDVWLVDSETSLRNMHKSGADLKHLREQTKQHKVGGIRGRHNVVMARVMAVMHATSISNGVSAQMGSLIMAQ